jgi:hypothetical protein
MGVDVINWNRKYPQQIIDLRQAIMDSLEIKNGFPKKRWDLCTFRKEQY